MSQAHQDFFIKEEKMKKFLRKAKIMNMRYVYSMVNKLLRGVISLEYPLDYLECTHGAHLNTDHADKDKKIQTNQKNDA